VTRHRECKTDICRILSADDWADRLGELRDIEPERAVGALLSLRLDPDEEMRWRSVAAFGVVVPAMAEQGMDLARKVFGRFMWMMNEESGNIGWGLPEAMGEIMANHEGLAHEYHRKLASFIQQPESMGDDNYMDHPPLREAAYWGLARLAQVRPELVRPVVPDMIAHLDHEEASELLRSLLVEETVAGKAYICWALGELKELAGRPAVEKQAGSQAPVAIFRNFKLERTTLGAVAREALEKMS
jgi:hypothetical protein